MKVAIVGATGAVGAELLSILERRGFPVSGLRAYASERSVGRQVSFAGRAVVVEALPEDGDLGADVVFSSAGGSVSKAAAWRWAEHGALVVDNTSAWRMDERVPLVVPEVNPHDVSWHSGVIANPNCSTIIALMVLAPLHEAFGLRRAVVATYQAVSGAGLWGIEELEQQTAAALAGSAVTPQRFRHPIAFNVFSHDSDVGTDGYNAEERKLLLESRKILGLPDLAVSATCVRVPVARAHSEAIHASFAAPVDPARALDVLRSAPGVAIVDDPATNTFPMPLSAADVDDVLVGRVRADTALENGLALFVAGDQIRKGAALNAVQVAELALGVTGQTGGRENRARVSV